MIGVSQAIMEIQHEFLDFEVKYKTTQNIFSQVYSLSKTVKRAKMDDINEKSYKLAEMFTEMSEHYLLTKTKIMEIDGDYSLLDSYVKQVVITMLEENKTMLTNIEVDLKVLLDMLVGKKIITKRKINKLIEAEERAKDSVIFVSKYETIYPSEESDIVINRVLRVYFNKLIVILPLLPFFYLIISGKVTSLVLWMTNTLTSATGEAVGSVQELNSIGDLSLSNELYPSSDFIEPMINYMMSLANMLCGALLVISLAILIGKIMIDLLYISIPELRPILSQIFGNSLTFSENDLFEPVQIEKFKLVRAKEILLSLRGIPEYANNIILINLSSRLRNKTSEETLSMEDSYSILLTESLYNIVNTYYKTNKEIVDYSLNVISNTKVSFNPLLIRVMVLKQRLGLDK